MAVPSDNYSARSSAFNSTRSDQPDADDAIPDDEFFATTPTHLATPTRDAPPVHTTVTTATLYNASTGIRADPHERKRSVCRIVLLVLLLLAFVTVAVLSYLTFVDTSITVLIWGLCMIPIGLFLLTCWCACWPATAVEKRISACFKRNCCHLNC